MFDLTGKTALVTGATGGIGGAIARALHAQGAHVVLSGTRESVLTELAAQFGERVSFRASVIGLAMKPGATQLTVTLRPVSYTHLTLPTKRIV